MKRKFGNRFLFLIPAWVVLVSLSLTWAGEKCFLSTRSPAWESLFVRSAGWTTGADGIYSIPLSGVDSPGGETDGWTLFVFGDTLIGKVLPGDVRAPDSRLVHNTVALLYGDRPDAQTISFFWGTDDLGQPQAVFRPNTPEADPGEWYWMMDGLVLDKQLYLFALRLKRTGPGDWAFAIDGVARLSNQAAMPLEFSRYRQVDTPLYRPETETRGEIVFGCAILPNTASAGSPEPDGYVYVYGTLTEKPSRKMVVSRVRPEDFADFDRWRFWNGSGWDVSVEAAAPVAERLSQEFSVTPLASGCYAAVFQLDGLGPRVAAALAPTPFGPFGPPVTIWTCPEPGEGQEIYVYNAKAHPHLSRPGELLITYNVNSYDNETLFHNADIYRPRFVRTWKFDCCDRVDR